MRAVPRTRTPRGSRQLRQRPLTWRHGRAWQRRSPEPVRALLALVGGAALACSFAPLQFWPLAVICPALQMWLWEDASPRSAARSGFCFGAGTFGVGIWWLYLSIHGPGEAPMWLALALVLALVGIMSLYQALLGWLVARLLPRSGALRWLVALPGLWLLVEWWRGWFLSGFPWLGLGYSQTDTVLAGFAPIAGVYGISALLLLGSGALLALLRAGRQLWPWAWHCCSCRGESARCSDVSPGRTRSGRP